MDSSDGLGDALYKICVMSKISMEIDYSKIPYDTDMHKVFNNEETIKNKILFGGEDYELITTLTEEEYVRLKLEIPLTQIGVVKKPDEKCFVHVKFDDGAHLKISAQTLDANLYKHFE